MYKFPMRIVRDEPKRRLNLEAHGLDVADFEAGFAFETVTRFEIHASPTGRTRYALIDGFRGELVTVGVVSSLGAEAMSLVSFRPASKRERAACGF